MITCIIVVVYSWLAYYTCIILKKMLGMENKLFDILPEIWYRQLCLLINLLILKKGFILDGSDIGTSNWLIYLLIDWLKVSIPQ